MRAPRSEPKRHVKLLLRERKASDAKLKAAYLKLLLEKRRRRLQREILALKALSESEAIDGVESKTHIVNENIKPSKEKSVIDAGVQVEVKVPTSSFGVQTQRRPVVEVRSFATSPKKTMNVNSQSQRM